MTQSNQRIDAEAADWAVRLQLRELTTQEQAELDRWLETGSRHRGALLRARAAWVDLDRLAALAGPGATPGTALQAHIPSRTPEKVGIPRYTHTRRRWLAAASVSVLMLGTAGTWWTHLRGEVYVSAVGEVRSVTLSDGSGMVLNTATEATVRFDRARREVDINAGEGLFQVVKDPKRPFIVRAGSVLVRAIGTAFTVRTDGRRVDVTVAEGVVELADENGSTFRVPADAHAVVTQIGQVSVQRIAPAEVDRQLAWREGMLDFAGDPLGTAVAEINRHSTRHIVVDDPTLLSRPVVGLFRANDPSGFATTVAMALGLESIDEADAIHLREGDGR